MSKAFSAFPLKDGLSVSLDPKLPSHLRAWKEDPLWLNSGNETHFGYVHSGYPKLTVPVGDTSRAYPLVPGQYFCVPGELEIRGGSGIIVTKEEYRGMLQIGGVVERGGRLSYIDGCTDTLLVSPPKLGDPCLNLLYFPPGIDQTEHTHPSDRIGIVMSGRGKCVHRLAPDADPVEVDLVPGMLFCIHTDGLHKFATPYGEEMRVLAYHPDSDFGPSDEAHPMLNRTMVDGVSARDIPEIRTKRA